jgi:folate-binding protein YgfZ
MTDIAIAPADTRGSAAEARWLSETVGVRALDERLVLRVSGDDARTWLNGQITNDVRQTAPGEAVYALAIHVKGRVIADLHAIDRGAAGLAIVVPRANLAALLEHFDKYVIMEDVTLAPEDETAIVTVQGPRAAEVALGIEWPAFPVDRLGGGGRDVLVPAAEKGRALDLLAERARALGGGPVSREGWELARMRAARPTLFEDFGETTYPQEVGLKSLAVSFQKGCYLGQEVVCMLENRGQLTRRLVQLESAAALEKGDELRDASGARIGEVTSALVDPERGATLALGFVKRAHASEGTEVTSAKGTARVLGLAGAD